MCGDVPDRPVWSPHIKRDTAMSPKSKINSSAELAVGEAKGPRLRSVLQACRELGVSRSLLYELISSGALRSVKVRRRRLIPTASIDAFVANLSKEQG